MSISQSVCIVRLCHLLFALAVMVPAHPKAQRGKMGGDDDGCYSHHCQYPNGDDHNDHNDDDYDDYDDNDDNRDDDDR